MAGKKLTAAERLAKLKAMQGERGKEFAGGKKAPAPEPPQKEAPSVFDKPPAKPVQEEPDEGNQTQGLELDDSAVVEVEKAPSSSRAPSTRVDSKPHVVEEPEESEPAATPVVEEPAPDASPSLEDLLAPPAGLDAALDMAALDAALGPVESSSEREDETKPEVPKRSSKPPASRTLMSADLGEPVSQDLASAVQFASGAPEEAKVPDGKKYTVNANATGETTGLVSGIVVKYLMPSASSKIFVVKNSAGAENPVELAPGDEKSFEMETPDGKVSITMQNMEGEVTAYVVGGKTKMANAAAKAGKAAAFLANVRYYLPELTMATLCTAATTAVLWTQQFVSDTLQNFHKPAVIAYGVFQLGFTAWAFIEQRKMRKTAEAKEALKE